MAKKTSKGTSKKSETQSPQFKISIDLGGVFYEGIGETAKEALLNLKSPVKITTKGIVNLSMGEKKKTLLYTPKQVKRLYWKVGREVQAKILSSFLK